MEKIFDVAVVEDALQLETIRCRSSAVARSGRSATGFLAQHNSCHLQGVSADDVEAVTGRVRTGVAGMEEREQHAPRFQHRPQPPDHRLHQALVEVIRQIPAQYDVEVRRRVDQVFGEKFAGIEASISLLIFREKFRIGGGSEQVFAVDSVAAFGEVADVDRRGRSQVQNAEALSGLPGARQFSQAAGAASKLLDQLLAVRGLDGARDTRVVERVDR